MLLRCHVLILESLTRRYYSAEVLGRGRQPDTRRGRRYAKIRDPCRPWEGLFGEETRQRRTPCNRPKGASPRASSQSSLRSGWRLMRMWFTKPFIVKARRRRGEEEKRRRGEEELHRTASA